MESKISFTQTIKEELCLLEQSDDVLKGILSSFIRVNGTISFRNNEERLVLITENARIAKYMYKLIKYFFKDNKIFFSYRRSMNFNKSTQYLINLVGNLDNVYQTLYLDFLESKINYLLTNKEERIIGYLTGLFLASGSCNDPSSSNYHLEFSFHNEDFANAVLKMISKIKSYSFSFKLIKRRNNYVVYLKRSDEISSFLAFLNASNSCMEFENIRVDRDLSNILNRTINCDSYNYKKTMEKAKEQIECIDLLDTKIGIPYIQNIKVKTLCKIRKENPEATYNELAVLMSETLDEKVSKSNVNHLFIKIKKMSEQYKE